MPQYNRLNESEVNKFSSKLLDSNQSSKDLLILIKNETGKDLEYQALANLRNRLRKSLQSIANKIRLSEETGEILDETLDGEKQIESESDNDEREEQDDEA